MCSLFFQDKTTCQGLIEGRCRQAETRRDAVLGSQMAQIGSLSTDECTIAVVPLAKPGDELFEALRAHRHLGFLPSIPTFPHKGGRSEEESSYKKCDKTSSTQRLNWVF